MDPDNVLLIITWGSCHMSTCVTLTSVSKAFHSVSCLKLSSKLHNHLVQLFTMWCTKNRETLRCVG